MLRIWTPRHPPCKTTILEGRYVRLEPLDVAYHGSDLFQALSGPEREELFTWITADYPEDQEDFDKWLNHADSKTDCQYYVIVDKETKRIGGRLTSRGFNLDHGTTTISVVFNEVVAKKRAATEAIYLIAKNVFETGFRRLEWQSTVQNLSSIKAAIRLGFTFEGTIRQYLVSKGQIWSNFVFSMIDKEWAVVNQAFIKWLDPSNFDSDGIQKVKLGDIRARIKSYIESSLLPPLKNKILDAISSGPSTSQIYEMIEDPKYQILTIDKASWRPLKTQNQPLLTLEGRYVSLEPLDVEKYGDELYNALNFQNFKQFYRYFGEYPPSGRENFQVCLHKSTMSKNQLNFVIAELTTNKILGLQTLLNPDLKHGSIELGVILWNNLDLSSKPLYEAIFLGAQYVFEYLSYRRLEWRCDNKDDFLKMLAEKFGFAFEVVFRQFMVIRGDNVDMALFSILEGDWMKIKEKMEKCIENGHLGSNGVDKDSN